MNARAPHAPATDLQIARLAHRRDIDVPVDPAVGLDDLLSVHGVYVQLRAARRIPDPLSCRETSRGRFASIARPAPPAHRV